jgi:hypothetical protein
MLLNTIPTIGEYYVIKIPAEFVYINKQGGHLYYSFDDNFIFHESDIVKKEVVPKEKIKFLKNNLKSINSQEQELKTIKAKTLEEIDSLNQ